MSRASRLLDLLQVLRRHRRPVAGQALAAELGVSLRTLYRDIATLQAQGADISGEAGIGYVLKPGFLLPPLMFSAEEIEALVLGSRWVANRADGPLGAAAREALAKISAVLPAELRADLEAAPLLIGPGAPLPPEAVDLATLRRAMRAEVKLEISYTDEAGRASARTVWPFAIGFFDNRRMLVAWCELRNDYRHFRTDRIVAATETTTRYPRRRTALMKEWRARTGITQRL
jgi:predicted DNA-binding transcriptional regulator YafY